MLNSKNMSYFPLFCGTVSIMNLMSVAILLLGSVTLLVYPQLSRTFLQPKILMAKIKTLMKKIDVGNDEPWEVAS